MARNRNLLKSSGQWWKLQLFAAATFLGGITMFAGLLGLHTSPRSSIVAFVGLVIGIGAFLFACVAIHCPSCGAHWFWNAIRKQGVGRWVLSLLEAERCDVCGAESFGPDKQRYGSKGPGSS